MKKIVVGMSGGVDSSVTASLMVEKGYEVTGVYIEAYNEPGCRADDDKRDALKVATKLGIKFQVLDLRKEYKERVIKYFFEEYEAGRTPNPDVVCNGEIKFGLFYDWAMEHGYDKVATGHYARIGRVPSLSSSKFIKQLQRPKDLTKDQTYFLWQVPQERLKNILFPLGEMTKKEVRAKAKELGLPNADKPDSMGVCMMGELNVHEFLKNKLGEREGEVVMLVERSKVKGQSDNAKPVVIGTHMGLWFHTVGERGGWEMGAMNKLTNAKLQKLGINTTKMPPLYVIHKDVANNRLAVGERSLAYASEFTINNFQFSMKKSLFVRIRNLGELVQVKSLSSSSSGKLEVRLEGLVFAPAPGQSAVFYDHEGVVVGGGIISV